MNRTVRDDPWLVSVVKRVCIFLYAIQLVILFLFWVGNVQNFADGTQYMLLGLYEISGLLFLTALVYYWGLRLALIFRRGRFSWMALVFGILGGFQCLVTLLLVTGLVQVSLGSS